MLLQSVPTGTESASRIPDEGFQGRGFQSCLGFQGRLRFSPSCNPRHLLRHLPELPQSSWLECRACLSRPTVRNNEFNGHTLSHAYTPPTEAARATATPTPATRQPTTARRAPAGRAGSPHRKGRCHRKDCPRRPAGPGPEDRRHAFGGRRLSSCLCGRHFCHKRPSRPERGGQTPVAEDLWAAAFRRSGRSRPPKRRNWPGKHRPAAGHRKNRARWTYRRRSGRRNGRCGARANGRMGPRRGHATGNYPGRSGTSSSGEKSANSRE